MIEASIKKIRSIAADCGAGRCLGCDTIKLCCVAYITTVEFPGENLRWICTDCIENNPDVILAILAGSQ